MSWVAIKPTAPVKRAGEPVEFSVGKANGPGKENRLCALLTLRLGLMEEPPEFLKVGATVQILQGNALMFGMLRITPGKDFRLFRPGGKVTDVKGIALLRFPLPSNVLAAKGRSAVEFDHGTDWLEITIPGWALDPAATARLVPQPALAPAVGNGAATKPAGFQMAKDTKHDVRRGS